VAIVIAVTGQALLLSRPVLLAYSAVLLATFVLLVRFYDGPSLARRFGAGYEAYRKRVPAWWPRRPSRTS
jgi:protein-S-isoprenylcysteine O-methyltransferase Ste14